MWDIPEVINDKVPLFVPLFIYEYTSPFFLRKYVWFVPECIESCVISDTLFKMLGNGFFKSFPNDICP